MFATLFGKAYTSPRRNVANDEETSCRLDKPRVRPTRRPATDAGRCRNSSSFRFRVRRSAAPATLRRPPFRCGRRWLRFRAHSRLWQDVAQARPLARIAPSRKLQARHRRLCRAPTCADSSLHLRRSPALRSAPMRQPRSLIGEGNLSWAAHSPFFDHSVAARLAVLALLRRSRVRSQQSHTLRDALL